MTDERQERPQPGDTTRGEEIIGHVIELYVQDADGSIRRVDRMSEWEAGQRRNRQVAHTVVGDVGRVSTIFTGIDHGDVEGVPMVFETAVKRGTLPWEPAGRAATRVDALVLHGRLVEELKQASSADDAEMGGAG